MWTKVTLPQPKRLTLLIVCISAGPAVHKHQYSSHAVTDINLDNVCKKGNTLLRDLVQYEDAVRHVFVYSVLGFCKQLIDDAITTSKQLQGWLTFRFIVSFNLNTVWTSCLIELQSSNSNNVIAFKMFRGHKILFVHTLPPHLEYLPSSGFIFNLMIFTTWSNNISNRLGQS